MIQIARGIARAHDLEVIHRDLKPENVFLCKRENGSDLIKILDFGIARSRQDARLTGAGELFGTPQYMAPERIRGEDAGVPADLYALGVVYFEMATGRLPYDAHDITSYFVKHLNAPTPHPKTLNKKVPDELDDLVVRLMAKDPAARPVDAHRVVADLVAIVEKHGWEKPVEPETDPASTARIPSAPLEFEDPWTRRLTVLEQMLTRAFGAAASAPKELTKLLAQVQSLVRRIGDLRDARMKEIRKLEDIESRGRDGRQRFGFAVDALGVDLSKAKEDERAARAKLATMDDAAAQAIAEFKRVHRDVSFWEGRSGFTEPYADLAEAYRTAADRVDAWLAVRKDEAFTRTTVESSAQMVVDIDYQIRELRTALAHHEQTIDREQSACEEAIAEMGKDVDQLEAELSALVTRFTEPLKARPELAPLLEQLQPSAA
jgi:serine/threonine-protein kinase